MHRNTHGDTPGLDTPASLHDTAEPSAVIIAKLAFKGHVVHSCMDGSFIVCKYGLSHYAQDFDELKAFAKKLGVLNDPI
jgi:hypothetical protein